MPRNRFRALGLVALACVLLGGASPSHAQRIPAARGGFVNLLLLRQDQRIRQQLLQQQARLTADAFQLRQAPVSGFRAIQLSQLQARQSRLGLLIWRTPPVVIQPPRFYPPYLQPPQPNPPQPNPSQSLTNAIQVLRLRSAQLTRQISMVDGMMSYSRRTPPMFARLRESLILNVLAVNEQILNLERIAASPVRA